MELITNILIEYLKHNKRIVVPKLGAFIVKQPSGIIRFTDLIRNDDGVLRSLLVAYGMNELEATGKIDRYVFEIRHAVNQGERYTIADLGEFRAGENNTILFNHTSEPKIIGGSIKPPVEALNIEKLKLGLLTNAISLSEGIAKPQKPKDKVSTADSGKISSNKPDHYLRGLNYDDRKKKHNEGRADKRKTPRGLSPLLLLLIVLMIACGGYGIWHWLANRHIEPYIVEPIVEESLVEQIDSLPAIDTLLHITEQGDTLQNIHTKVLNREIHRTTNMVTE